MALIATLIAHSSNPILSSRLIKKAAQTVNSSDIRWLADNIACDIMLPAAANPHICRAALHSAIGTAAIDIVIQEIKNRRKRLLIADMDSTMIQQECIDELASEKGLKDKIATITSRAMNGEIRFETALRDRAALLAGMPVEIIETIIAKRITFTPGGHKLIATMKKNGSYTVLVSGAFTVFTRIIAAVLDFNEHYANTLIEQDNVFTGKVAEPILNREEKARILLKIARRLGISSQEVLAVGDGANDLDMIKIAGSGVALHAKPILAEKAPIRIDHGDLTALLYIQGYKESEIIDST